MIKISKNQDVKASRGRPRLDRWRLISVTLEQALVPVRFFEVASRHDLSESLPDPTLFDFRDRFTAAFLRYLVFANIGPVKAAAVFDRSWRQFQRYLVGGDQVPKLAVVQQLARVSVVPSDWIIGTQISRSRKLPRGMIEVDIYDWLRDPLVRTARLALRPYRGILPVDIFGMTTENGTSLALVIIGSPPDSPHLQENDTVVMDRMIRSLDQAVNFDIFIVSCNGDVGFVSFENYVNRREFEEDQKATTSKTPKLRPGLSIIGKVVWIGRKR